MELNEQSISGLTRERRSNRLNAGLLYLASGAMGLSTAFAYLYNDGVREQFDIPTHMYLVPVVLTAAVAMTGLLKHKSAKTLDEKIRDYS